MAMNAYLYSKVIETENCTHRLSNGFVEAWGEYLVYIGYDANMNAKYGFEFENKYTVIVYWDTEVDNLEEGWCIKIFDSEDNQVTNAAVTTHMIRYIDANKLDMVLFDINNLSENGEFSAFYEPNIDYNTGKEITYYRELDEYNYYYGIVDEDEKDYGPSNPWDAPGMKVSDFI